MGDGAGGGGVRSVSAAPTVAVRAAALAAPSSLSASAPFTTSARFRFLLAAGGGEAACCCCCCCCCCWPVPSAAAVCFSCSCFRCLYSRRWLAFVIARQWERAAHTERDRLRLRLSVSLWLSWYAASTTFAHDRLLLSSASVRQESDASSVRPSLLLAARCSCQVPVATAPHPHTSVEWFSLLAGDRVVVLRLCCAAVLVVRLRTIHRVMSSVHTMNWPPLYVRSFTLLTKTSSQPTIVPYIGRHFWCHTRSRYTTRKKATRRVE